MDRTVIQISTPHSEPRDVRRIDVEICKDVGRQPVGNLKRLSVIMSFKLEITRDGIRIDAKNGLLGIRPVAANVVVVDIFPEV